MNPPSSPQVKGRSQCMGARAARNSRYGLAGFATAAEDLLLGTHVDAPAHFSPGAATVDKLPPEALMGPAAVVDGTAQVAQNPDYEVSHRWR